MARKIIDQLFPTGSEKPDRVLVSLKAWKALLTRLNQLESQVRECQAQIRSQHRFFIREKGTESSPFLQQTTSTKKDLFFLRAQLKEQKKKQKHLKHALFEQGQKTQHILHQIRAIEMEEMGFLESEGFGDIDPTL